MMDKNGIIMESEDGLIVYKIITPDMYEEALDLINKSFFPYGALSVATGISLNPDAVEEMDDLIVEIFEDNISVAAIDKNTGRIIGLTANRIEFQKNEDEESSENFLAQFRSPEVIEFMRFVMICDNKVNVFKEYGVDRLMDITFLSILPEYRNRGVAQGIITADLKLLELSPSSTKGIKVASAMMTSPYSQAIAKKLKFDALRVFHFSELECESVKYSNKLDLENKSSVSVAKRVGTMITKKP